MKAEPGAMEFEASAMCGAQRKRRRCNLILIARRAAEQRGSVMKPSGLIDQLLDIHGDLDALG
jgi:hypothetical protein